MFKDNFVLVGLSELTKNQLESMFAIDGQCLRYVRKTSDISAAFHKGGDVTYIVDLSKILSYASDILAKIAEFQEVEGVYFVVITSRKPPKLLKRLRFKTLELHSGGLR